MDVVVGSLGPNQVQRRCALVDVDDLSTLLNSFAGGAPICGDPCPSGASKNIPPTPCLSDLYCPNGVPCVGGFCDFDADGPPSACHDSGIPGSGQSMSETECFILGGTYCCDNSHCGDPGCP
ncbi:MAG: hypothetical protein AABZ47_03865 [Planctomycetota bacterium]